MLINNYASMLKAESQALEFTCLRIVFKDDPGPHSKVLGKCSPDSLSYRM